MCAKQSSFISSNLVSGMADLALIPWNKLIWHFNENSVPQASSTSAIYLLSIFLDGLSGDKSWRGGCLFISLGSVFSALADLYTVCVWLDVNSPNCSIFRKTIQTAMSSARAIRIYYKDFIMKNKTILFKTWTKQMKNEEIKKKKKQKHTN